MLVLWYCIVRAESDERSPPRGVRAVGMPHAPWPGCAGAAVEHCLETNLVPWPVGPCLPRCLLFELFRTIS